MCGGLPGPAHSRQGIEARGCGRADPIGLGDSPELVDVVPGPPPTIPCTDAHCSRDSPLVRHPDVNRRRWGRLRFWRFSKRRGRRRASPARACSAVRSDWRSSGSRRGDAPRAADEHLRGRALIQRFSARGALRCGRRGRGRHLWIWRFSKHPGSGRATAEPRPGVAGKGVLRSAQRMELL